MCIKQMMFQRQFNLLLLYLVSSFLFFQLASADKINKIIVQGNDRISSETIIMFSDVKEDIEIDTEKLNLILKIFIYKFFKDVSVAINDNILKIDVLEFPIIQEIKFNGIKAEKIKKEITTNLNLKSRSSFNSILLEQDKNNITNSLKNIGYYFSNVDVYVTELDNNKVDIIYEIKLGDKAKIKKITFVGNKVFKNKKLKSLIASEEYKFWKLISGKKYLNQSLIDFDKQLLKNFYLNKGFYDVEINSSFARLVDDENFELIFNIDAKKKLYFDSLSLTLPENFDENNFIDLKNLFEELKGKHYSINSVNKILDKIDLITINEEYQSIKASVDENIVDDKINLNFIIEETDRFVVEKINIFGNNVTRENVIRNQFEIDEGDIYNEILQKKSINNIKSLRFLNQLQTKFYLGFNQIQK